MTAPEGKILQIQGEVAPRTGLDSLYVYDGVDINATELLKEVARASVSKNSSGRNMLLHYMELGEDRGFGAGLFLKVSVVDPNQEYSVSFWEYSNGSVTSNLTSAKINTPVTLTATPEPGYYLHHVRVFGEQTGFDVAKTGGTWYSDGNEISFLMPAENVVIEPYFASESQDPGIIVSRYET